MYIFAHNLTFCLKNLFSKILLSTLNGHQLFTRYILNVLMKTIHKIVTNIYIQHKSDACSLLG